MVRERKKKSFLKKITRKYRLVILNRDTYEEKASFNLTRLNIIVLISTFFVFTSLFVAAFIVFTPLKEYIPGYGSMDIRREVISLSMKADSLESVIRERDGWIESIKIAFAGEPVPADTATLDEPPLMYDTIALDYIPPEDAMLRREMESMENYSIDFSEYDEDENFSFSKVHFAPPLKGIITNRFNIEKGHYGIDIVSPEGEPVTAILDGMVIMSNWTLETGNVIGIQHKGSLVSFYKHNSVLLKKVGTFVDAGEAIAIVGSSGELSTGPHLHFELWHKGLALNPEEFIIFQN